MNTPTHFPDVAATLAANGYRPVPIKPGTKYPGFDEWEKFTFAPDCEKRYRKHGAGVLLGDVVGLDIDVDDPDAAAAIEEAAREILGLGDVAEIPRRIGRPPRVLLPLRTSSPFRKITSALFKMRSTGTANKVEVLAVGQQFVAYHVHPDTRRAYTWNGAGDLLSVPRDELPEITEAQARQIVQAAETILEEWGERVVEPADKKPGATPGQKIVAGACNETLYRFGCKLAREHFSVDEIEAALLAMNTARCDPPRPDADVRTIARKSVAKYVPEAAAPASGWPDPLDFYALAQREPQPAQFIVADWLPAGYATLFAGHGGVGKSAIGLHAGACIGLGVQFFGIECERRRVLYLSCEDRTAILHWRLHHLCAYRHVELAELRDCLDLLDLVGHDTVLWDRDPRTGATVTPAFGQLAQRIERSGTQVLIVDGVSDTFAGNENARPDVKRYVNALLSLLPDDGALLLLGHVNRPAASNPATSEGYSGSTQWHNAVRARWYLYPETEKDDNDRAQRSGRLMLELQKSNLGAVQPAMAFRYDEDAKLFIGTGLERGGGIVESIRERTERGGIVQAKMACAAAGIPVPAAMQGPRTAYLVLTQRPEFPDSLRGGAESKRRRFARHLEGLRQIRHIVEASIRRSNRHLLATLEPTPEGCAECASI